MKKLKPAKTLGEIKEAKKIEFDLPSPPLTITENRKNSKDYKLGEQYKKLFKPEYLDIAGRLVAAGFSEKDLGYAFNVPYEAVDSWKRNNPAFKAVCDEGKRREKKKLVAKALLSSVGYDYETSKTKYHKDADGVITKSEVTEFKNHQPANHNLLMFILCNIDKQLGDSEWHSKHKLEIDQNKNIKITVDGKLATEQIQKLAGKILESE